MQAAIGWRGPDAMRATRWHSRSVSTAPTCPQCGQPGVRTVQVTSTGTDSPTKPSRILWVCEQDHRFS